MLRIALLCKERGWDRYPDFDIALAEARTRAATEDGNPDLLQVTVARRTYDRWTRTGEMHKPRWETGRVLSFMFDVPARELFEDVGEQTGPLDSFSPAAARSVRPTPGVSPEALAVMVRKLDEVIEDYEELGPHQLSRETLFVHTMLGALSGGHRSLREQEHLLHLAGRASALLGYMATAAGRFAAADAHLREAWTIATDLGDTDLRIWTLGTQAFRLYYLKRYEESEHAARMAVDLAPTSPLAIRPLVNGRARALARMGRAREADHAIAAALALSDRSDGLPDGVSSCISLGPYSVPRTLANAITAQLSLGNTRRVFELADEIAPMVASSESRWTRALVGLDLASAHLQGRSPDLEQAMRLGARALTADGMTPIRSVHQRGQELLDQASKWRRKPEVRDYAAQLHVWESDPRVARLAARTTT
ncbi:hypothetical protein [Kitasatospora sp. NPDC087315]|uniref:hypothetical protein n=1 Tax=Kitasatospora sp. NPDC087315 TaxID=3364069 RepID=UPI00381CD413